MPIEMKITADTTEQLRQQLADLLFADGASVQRYYAVSRIDAETAASITEPPEAATRPESPDTAQEKKETPKKPRAKKDHAAPTAAAEPATTPAHEDDATPVAAGSPLTHDNVRNVLGAYVKKFGMEAAQADGPKLIASLFGDGKGKVSDIPDTQEALTKAVTSIEEMLAKNPYSRKEAA